MGKLFPITAYDFFPLQNFRTDFVDAMNVANLVIPLPSYGFGGFVMFRPQPNIYCRFGLHDANADAPGGIYTANPNSGGTVKLGRKVRREPSNN